MLLAGSNSIDYEYGADGTKLRTVHKTGSTTLTTDYCGNAIYENSVLKMLLNEAGYVSFPDKKFHFYIKDHLGNTRIVSDKDGNVEETNAYYPFGGNFTSTANIQPYKYNGKELDEKNGLNWYDYGARHYDAAIGRWHVVDPMAEKYYSINSYVYVANNPIRNIDPEGDTIFVDNTGYIMRNDNKDNLVYNNNTFLGELGGEINIDEIYSNLLAKNISESEDIINPFTFRNKVKTNGEWDLKNNKNTIYGLGNDGKTIFNFDGNKMEAQDIGNHHFGAVALAYGWFPSEKFILKQAGEYQIKSGTSKLEWQIYQNTTITVGSPTIGVHTVTKREMMSPYGDDPRDQKWIKSGFNFYKTIKK